MKKESKVKLKKEDEKAIYRRVSDEFRSAVMGHNVRGSVSEDWNTYKPTVERYKLTFEPQGIPGNTSLTKFVITANDLIGHLYHEVTATYTDRRGDESYIDEEYDEKKRKSDPGARYGKYTGNVLGFVTIHPESSEVTIDSIDITNMKQLL